MKLSDLPWGQIAKFTAAGLGAVGLFGGGYLTAPKAPQEAKQIACEASTITIPLKVYINGQEVRQAK